MTKIEKLEFDEIGLWSEIKLEIINKYLSAYTLILSQQSIIKKYVYIDAFCGAGVHRSKEGDRIISGSPFNAINTKPPFTEYYFIDLDSLKMEYLMQLIGDRKDVHYFNSDCNNILLSQILPLITYENYNRALCLLDPYGLDLDWAVIEKAGKSRAIEIFLNFPVMDMNRNAFWKDYNRVSQHNIDRINKFWGDDSWKNAAYCEEQGLFGTDIKKTDNETIVECFRKRLIDKAGFKFVPEPIPMKNSKGAIVYYLFFASCNKVGSEIVTNIFDKYRS
jgi:three-Cys-motif partner protein